MSGNPQIKASIKEAENHYKGAGAKTWQKKYFFILDLHAPYINKNYRNIFCDTCKYYSRVFLCCKSCFFSVFQLFRHIQLM